MDEDIIVYDIETKESFNDVGGRDPRKLHISMLGMYSYAQDELIGYTEAELPQFWRRLERCSLLVGFNSHGFDNQVVEAYFPEITKVPSFDILEEVVNRLGFRLKLDNIAQATLNVGKSGDGLKAIELFRQGKIEELRSYCLDDVKITKDLFQYGRDHGRLYYSDLKGKKDFFVDFTREIERPAGAMNLSLF